MKKFERSNRMSADAANAALPSLALEDGVIVNKDFTLAVGWRITLPFTSLASQEVLATRHNIRAASLNTLPTNYDIQFRYCQSSRVADLDQMLEKCPVLPGVAGEAANQARQVVRKLFNNQALSFKYGYIFLVRIPKPKEIQPPPSDKRGFWGWLKASVLKSFQGAPKLQQITREAFNTMAAELNQFAMSVESSLRQAGNDPKRLDNHAALDALYGWWMRGSWENGLRPKQFNPAGKIPVSEYFVLSDFHWDDHGNDLPRGVFYLDGKYHSLLSLQLPADSWTYNAFEGIFCSDAAPVRMEMVLNATHHPSAKRLKKLNEKRTQLEKSAKPEDKTMANQVLLELQEIGSGVDSVWRAQAFFHIWADDVAQLKADEIRLQTALKQMDFSVVAETKRLWHYWTAIAPGWTQDRDHWRQLDMRGQHLASLLSLCGQETNLVATRPPGLLLPTVSASVLNIDVFDGSRYRSPHFLISAGTGAGKSAFLASFLLEMLGNDGQAVIADRGGSFKSLAESCGGAYLDIQPGNRDGCRLNPLYYNLDNVSQQSDWENNLHAKTILIESMLSALGETSDERITQEQRNTLRETLRKLFTAFEAERREATLTDLAESFDNSSDGRRLKNLLYAWTQAGPYGQLFDGPNSLPIKGAVTVFELGAAAESAKDRALQRVISMMLLSTVSQMLGRPDGRRKVLAFDEAKVLMEDPKQLEYLEFCFRTFRKLNIAVGAISQKAADLKPFFAHAAVLFFLRQDSIEDVQAAADGMPDFSPAAVAAIGRLQTVAGNRSEVVAILKASSGTTIHQLFNFATPLKYAIMTTTPPELAKIAEISALQNVPRDEAVRIFAAQYPQGMH
jgi:hypothetical protein